ncbi:MAG: TetR/AcrR family transcriptional regulator [Ignavibacteriaceae bacterium]|nr:TetR/AcrR family transcriptional regulator [Ignavibacteriaceae bacterium]
MPRTKEQFEEIRKSSRQKILDAALEVFAKQGYNSATVDAIAKTARISKGLMYNYFKSKDEVLNELMIGMMDALMCEYMPLKPDKKFTKDDIINFITVGIDLVLQKPHYWKLYFSVFVQPEVMVKVFDKMMKMGQPYLVAMIEYFKEKGVENPEVMMRYFSAVMDGIQFHCMIDPKSFPAEDVKKLLIKQFVL